MSSSCWENPAVRLNCRGDSPNRYLDLSANWNLREAFIGPEILELVSRYSR